MAKQTLPVNFKDDILASSMGGKRKYRLIDNGDGTYSLEDVTDYTQTGSDFGAGQINATNKAVNESCDKADVIDDLEDVVANQANGKIAGAKAVAELNGNLQWSEWTYLGSNIGLTSRYRKNAYQTEIYVQGTIDGSEFSAQTGYKVGTLPEGARPPYARRYQLTDTRLYIDVRADGGIYIISFQDISSTTSPIWFSECFGI